MTAKKKRIIGNIVFYVVLAFIYTIAIVTVITKFNGGTMYIFNHRADVVLTDSMSERNPNHADFLEGTTQIQPFDITVAEKVNNNTELNVKDCALFINPSVGKLVVHRIVNISQKGVEFKITNCAKERFNDMDVVRLDYMRGGIDMAVLDYTKISLEAYTTEEYSTYFNFFQAKNSIPTEVQTTKISDSVYKHIISYERTSSSPYRTSIRCANDELQYIASVTYTSKSKGELVFNASELVVDKDNSYTKLYDPYFLYEMRGDKSPTSDGYFKREQLLAKVNFTIPKLGRVVHFLQSIPGIIMLVGLSIVITVASFFWSNESKKKNSVEEVATGEVIDKPKEEAPKEGTPSKDEEKKDV